MRPAAEEEHGAEDAARGERQRRRVARDERSRRFRFGIRRARARDRADLGVVHRAAEERDALRARARGHLVSRRHGFVRACSRGSRGSAGGDDARRRDATFPFERAEPFFCNTKTIRYGEFDSKSRVKKNTKTIRYGDLTQKAGFTIFTPVRKHAPVTGTGNGKRACERSHQEHKPKCRSSNTLTRNAHDHTTDGIRSACTTPSYRVHSRWHPPK